MGTAESLTNRRRALAAQVAAGVHAYGPEPALLLETAAPLAPALLLAGAGGLAVGVWYSTATGVGSVPWTRPAGRAARVYASCLLSAATALPLLGRSVRPGSCGTRDEPETGRGAPPSWRGRGAGPYRKT